MKALRDKKSVEKKVLSADDMASAFLETIAVEDIYTKILLELVCISSASKMYREMNDGQPDPCDLEERTYWIQWDFGRALVTILAHHCRSLNLDPTVSHFWPLVDSYYQENYTTQYEFKREVVVDPADFEALCLAIFNDNIVLISDCRLTPKDFEEATGHYGEEVLWRIWLFEGKVVERREFHTDDYSLAQEVFHALNGRYVQDGDCGPSANQLAWSSRSIYEECEDY